jgi:hypothetical protein
VSGVSDVSIDFSGLARRVFESSNDYAWEWLANVPVKLIDTYAYMVKSRYDSTASDTGWQVFVVTGHTSDPFVYYDSLPDSGYSVDNLAPDPPHGLMAQYIGDSRLWLHWSPCSDPDLSHYSVYRGTSTGLLALSEDWECIGTTTDTSFVDDGYDPGNEYSYKVSAVDVHGNESYLTVLTPEMITDTPDVGRDYANVLYQNAPNPFLSSTRIAFSMKEAGHVRLLVFDAKGRLVRVLVDG